MVVASDSDPDPGVSVGFPFPHAGGALLLDSGDNGEGFCEFHFENFPEFEDLFVSAVSWRQGRRGWLPGSSGGHVLEVKEQEGYRAACIDRAAAATRQFLIGVGLSVEQLDLVVPSQFPLGFPDELAEQLGVKPDRLARVPWEFEGAHTAGPLAALEAAVRNGRFEEAEHTLFVTVGAGVTVGLALYRQPRRA
jgi:3-oxoacyl-[acyl-carrier-protein] synthase III